MNIGRRSFVGISTTAGLSTVLPRVAHTAGISKPEQKAQLKLSCQEGVAPGKTLTEKLDFLEMHSFEGIEPGGDGLARRLDEFQKALTGRRIKVSAICAGFKGVLISEQEPVRRQAVDSIKEILTVAGAFQSTGMIVVPAFNNQTQLGNKAARQLLLRLLPELGEHAQKAGTRVLLEPLNRREAFFLRQVADAAAICRDASNPGICCMGDFWHMTWEETSDLGAFISGGKYLHHVHIASRKKRNMPGEDEGDDYVDGFRGLKWIGYQDYVSLECGSVGDRSGTIPRAAKLLRQQWEQA
jgi:sugar phosphate isomerase/epimerase